MAKLELRTLIAKLNQPSRQALQAATGLCVTRGHYNVEIEHWLLQFIDSNDLDIPILLQHYGVNQAHLQRDLNQALDQLRNGNVKTPALSPDIVDCLQQAWLLASLNQQTTQIRSGHLLLALLQTDSLARLLHSISKEFAKISADDLQTHLAALTKNSVENTLKTTSSEPQTDGKTTALDRFTINLTEQAKQGKIDPVVGRDAEIRQMIDILTRRRQNNPILTGEAGVGKTAVVEGLALRIINNDVPKPLQKTVIRVLDLALLQAGAGVKGEFEQRLKSVITEVKQSPQAIILFIDEAHTLIGAGGSEGQGDAANLLKPALARGELRTIAATTWSEYKKYIEKDPALTRRFQLVKIEEPSEEQAIIMMRAIAKQLEQHHHVRILNEAIQAAVKLSKRYIADRKLPDKAVSLLDTACATVAMSHQSTPAAIEDKQRQSEHLTIEIAYLERETLTDGSHQKTITDLKKRQQTLAKELSQLTTRWEKEKALVSEMRTLRTQLESTTEIDDDTRKTTKQKLNKLNRELTKLQGEQPLISVCVDAHKIAEIIAAWTGVPIGKMLRSQITAMLELQPTLAKRVIGQDHALATISETLQISRAQLGDPRKPIGTFLLAGTSGTGKTETALALAECLYGDEKHITVINMSEFKEEHKVSLLLGSPPGYVGFGEGGVLTNAVRRRPYSIVLLDEMEKAHASVQEMFYQVFDKGMIMDGEGREVDFKNTIIIMTTNAGTQSIMQAYADDNKNPPETIDELQQQVRPELLHTFKPAFLGRVTVIPYIPLDAEVIKTIAKLQLAKVANRIQQYYQAPFTYSDAVLELMVERCQAVETGARNIEHLIQGNLLPAIAVACLDKLANGKKINTVKVDIDVNSNFNYEIR